MLRCQRLCVELGTRLRAAGRWADAGAGTGLQELVAESRLDLHIMPLWWAWDLPLPSMGSLLCHLSSSGKLGTLLGVKRSPSSMQCGYTC